MVMCNFQTGDGGCLKTVVGFLRHGVDMQSKLSGTELYKAMPIAISRIGMENFLWLLVSIGNPWWDLSFWGPWVSPAWVLHLLPAHWG